MKLNNLKLLRNLALGLTLFSGTAFAELAMNDTGVNDMHKARPAAHVDRVVQMNTTPQPEDMNESEMAWSSTIIKNIQKRLADKGFNVGPIDGVIGSKTRTALEDYQRSNDLVVTGSINENTVKSLGLEVNSLKELKADDVYAE